MNRKLYLFDFDGTITNKDTLFDFLNFTFPTTYNSVFIKYIPLFIATKFKLIKAEEVKRKFINSFLKNKNREEIEILADNYFENRKNIIIRPEALKYITNLSKEDNKYIVTASLDLWVKPFANYLGLRLISTKADFDGNIFHGKFKTPNCNYKEKVERIVKEIQLSQFNEIYAFGDTKGDKYMLELATHPHFRYFE